MSSLPWFYIIPKNNHHSTQTEWKYPLSQPYWQSTEIAIYDNGIKEMCNTKIGVIDVMEQYPDLGENLATTDVKTVREWVKTKLKIPTQKADVLILAGGGHMKFAKNSGITFEKNTLFEDKQEPIMMDINTRKLDTERYYKKNFFR